MSAHRDGRNSLGPASRMYWGQLPGVYGTHVDVKAKEFLYILSSPTPIYMRVQLSLEENEYLAAAALCVRTPTYCNEFS